MKAAETTPIDAINDLCSSASVVWVISLGDVARPLNQVWHEGNLYAVVNGPEQPDPTNGERRVTVVLPGASGATEGGVEADVEVIEPHNDTWSDIAPLLATKRLNSLHGNDLVDSWARSACAILKITPDPGTLRVGTALPDDDQRAPLVPTAATTVTWAPFHAGKRTRRTPRKL